MLVMGRIHAQGLRRQLSGTWGQKPTFPGMGEEQDLRVGKEEISVTVLERVQE